MGNVGIKSQYWSALLIKRQLKINSDNKINVYILQAIYSYSKTQTRFWVHFYTYSTGHGTRSIDNIIPHCTLRFGLKKKHVSLTSNSCHFYGRGFIIRIELIFYGFLSTPLYINVSIWDMLLNESCLFFNASTFFYDICMGND